MRSHSFWRLAGRLDHLRKDRNGAILPFFAIVLVLVIVLAGAGFDYARAVNQRQALARGLDTAMLAIARELSIRNMSLAEIKDFIDNNFEAYFSSNADGSANFGRNITLADPQIDTTARTISVSATSEVPTTFIRLGGLGPDTLDVGVSAQAIYPKSVEVALVVDVTGSMNGSKITALRKAAEEFVNILVPPGSASANEKIRIAVVPYAAGVNIGTARATAATHGANATRPSFNRCVSERTGDEAFTDTSYATDPVGPGTAQAGWNRGYYRSGGRVYSSSGFVCPSAQMVPLTLDPGSPTKSGTLLHTISRLSASGNTAGQTGIAWGWYALSNKWASLWPTESAPAPSTDERVLKYMVVMTDGAFNTYFDGPRRVRGRPMTGSRNSAVPSHAIARQSYARPSTHPGSESSRSGFKSEATQTLSA